VQLLHGFSARATTAPIDLAGRFDTLLARRLPAAQQNINLDQTLGISSGPKLGSGPTIGTGRAF
jgi:hypothetical protein